VQEYEVKMLGRAINVRGIKGIRTRVSRGRITAVQNERRVVRHSIVDIGDVSKRLHRITEGAASRRRSSGSLPTSQLLDVTIIEALERALEAHDGNQARAAREVGLSPSTVSKYVRIDPGLERFRKSKGKKTGRPSTVSIEEIIAALRASETISDASRSLGLSEKAILWYRKYPVVRVEIERLKERAEADALEVSRRIFQALVDSGGVKSKAAALVGVHVATVTRQLKRARPGTPLGIEKEIIKLRGRGVTDRDIVDAFKYDSFSEDRVAEILEVHPLTVKAILERAEPNSPIVGIRRVFELMSKGDQVAMALANNRGNKSRAASYLEIPTLGLEFLLMGAEPGSRLAIQRDIIMLRENEIEDEELIAAINRHDRNLVDAAKELEIDTETLSYILEKAAPKTLLAIARDLYLLVTDKNAGSKILEATRKAKGDIELAARQLGIEQQIISYVLANGTAMTNIGIRDVILRLYNDIRSNRVSIAGLKRFVNGTPRRKKFGQLPRRDRETERNAEIGAALIRHGGNKLKVALELDIPFWEVLFFERRHGSKGLANPALQSN